MKVGVQLQQQHTTVDSLRTAWRTLDQLGCDGIYVWDHFFPMHGDPRGAHFEAYSLLAAMAVDTRRATIGALVTANGHRNPNLLADMARTVDHLSGGRFVLGIGESSHERDHRAYGYLHGTPDSRLGALERNLEEIRERLQALNPRPVGAMPLLIGSCGRAAALRLVAQYADVWNTIGPLDNFLAEDRILRDQCEKLGRRSDEISRTLLLPLAEARDWEACARAGVDELIVELHEPFEVDEVADLVARVRAGSPS
jgi:probable F420-dependent oxidoreductase